MDLFNLEIDESKTRFSMKIILSEKLNIKEEKTLIQKNDPFLPPFDSNIFLMSISNKILISIVLFLINLC